MLPAFFYTKHLGFGWTAEKYRGSLPPEWFRISPGGMGHRQNGSKTDAGAYGAYRAGLGMGRTDGVAGGGGPK